jgi:hypothetical protein
MEQDYATLARGIIRTVKEELGGGVQVCVRFDVEFDIDEQPYGYKSWSGRDGGHNVDWDESWNSEVIHSIFSGTIKFKNSRGEFEVVDFDFTKHQFGYSGNGAGIEASCECWVSVPYTMAGDTETAKQLVGADGAMLVLNCEKVSGEFQATNLEIIDVDEG